MLLRGGYCPSYVNVFKEKADKLYICEYLRIYDTINRIRKCSLDSKKLVSQKKSLINYLYTSNYVKLFNFVIINPKK